MTINSLRIYMPITENFYLYSQFQDVEVLFLDQLALLETKKLNDLQLPINLKRLIITLNVDWRMRNVTNNYSKNEEEIKNNIKLPFGCELKLILFDCGEAFRYWSKHSINYEDGTVWICNSDCTTLRETL